VKILWISRHVPTEVQEDTLSELLNVPVEVTQYRATIIGCHALSNILDEYQPERVVASIPVGLQQQMVGILADRGMPPLIKPVYHHTRSDNGAPTVWTLMHFEEILSMDIERRILKHKEQQDG